VAVGPIQFAQILKGHGIKRVKNEGECEDSEHKWVRARYLFQNVDEESDVSEVVGFVCANCGMHAVMSPDEIRQ